ncbi:unnamed protein product [Phyllotreta striolata]|uniref:Uncharacterized protein n=1 Tax=Phyllotreta striolata TaxID=444603 RepID=A0A9N9TMC5_PHYSR|nr:unnamed protein product [Phyllotreta striolata]
MKFVIFFAVLAVVIFSCSAEEAPKNEPNISSPDEVTEKILRDIFDMLPLLLQKIIYGLYGLYLDIKEARETGGEEFSMVAEFGNFISSFLLP